MTAITNTSVDPLVLPLAAPFAVATRTAYEARNVLFRIVDDDGHVGLGSCTPVEYVTGESLESVTEALRAAGTQLVGKPTAEIEPLLADASELLTNMPAARAAMEMALYDLWGRNGKICLWKYFGAARAELHSDLTIPIVPPRQAAETAAEASSAGFDRFKIKVGDPAGIEADHERICAVSRATPHARLRVDANQAFEPDSAVEFVLRALGHGCDIELVEQPVAKSDFAGLAYVRSKLVGKTLVFADESAQTPEAVMELIRLGAVDGVNVKIMKSGVEGARRIAIMCRARGVMLMVGCMLESRLSLSAACALASGTGGFDFVDLDAHRLLAPTEVFAGGFRDFGPRLIPEMESDGWGVELAPKWNEDSPSDTFRMGCPLSPNQGNTVEFKQ
jgi:L-alanine-DL-glutamate epimerase-like enolase superfamily enzyme